MRLSVCLEVPGPCALFNPVDAGHRHANGLLGDQDSSTQRRAQRRAGSHWWDPALVRCQSLHDQVVGTAWLSLCLINRSSILLNSSGGIL